MQQVGIYNNLSDELIKSIPPLEGIVVFQMLNGVSNPEPDPTERAKLPMLYGKTQLLTQYKVKDPFSKKLVDIVWAEDWDDNKKPTKPICFVAGAGEMNWNGSFALSEGNMEHEELYQVLYLSPERQGSPCSDAKITPRFKMLNPKQDSQKVNTRHSIMTDAMQKAESMKEADARILWLSLGNEDIQDGTVLLAKVRAWVKERPENIDTFLARIGNPQTKAKATLKQALDAGVISYDASTFEVKTGNTIVTKLDGNSEGFKVIEALQSFIEQAANGTTIFEGIEKELKAKKKQVTA